MYPDIRMVPIDGTTGVDVRTLDVLDERAGVCRNGAFRPCECTPGEGGRDYCIGTAYEGMCRCGDAGPPAFDAMPDAVDEQFEHPIDDSGTPDGGTTQDSGTPGLMDARVG